MRKLVEKTLAENKIDLTANPVGRIGLDPSKSVGTAFELEGYPTLVILDGKGIVQSVHVGFNPEAGEPLHKALGKEIDALLEGKPLATPKEQLKEASKKSANDSPAVIGGFWLRWDRPCGVRSRCAGRRKDSRPLFSAAEFFDVTNCDQAGSQVLVEMGLAADSDSVRHQTIDVQPRGDVEIRNR